MRKFELWVEGVDLYSCGALLARKIADVEGPDFHVAVDNYVSTLPARQAVCWEYDESDQCWTWSGRRAYDNEQDARAIYG